MNPFVWDGSGVRVTLGAEERAMLPSLLALLETVVAGRGDPAAERLDPPAYDADPVADEEYRRLMAQELLDARARDRERFAATASAERLDEDDAEAWLRVLGDVRLTLAARKGIERDDDQWEDRIEVDPELGMLAYLGFLQGSLVDALMNSLENST